MWFCFVDPYFALNFGVLTSMRLFRGLVRSRRSHFHIKCVLQPQSTTLSAVCTDNSSARGWFAWQSPGLWCWCISKVKWRASAWVTCQILQVWFAIDYLQNTPSSSFPEIAVCLAHTLKPSTLNGAFLPSVEDCLFHCPSSVHLLSGWLYWPHGAIRPWCILGMWSKQLTENQEYFSSVPNSSKLPT